MSRSALFALFLFAAPAAAQGGQNNFGSVYSRFGVGERTDFGSAQAEMLGIAGVALRDGNFTGLSNPALWADLSVTGFGASVGITGIRAEDGSAADPSRSTAGDVSSLQLAVPLMPARLGAVIAYRPYSRVRYRSAIPGTLVTPVDTTSYTANREGEGGLQRLSVGVGWRPARPIQIGASADVVFGTFEYLQRTEFEQDGYLETRQAEATQVRGVTATVGATTSARRLLRDSDAITFGASLTLPARLRADRTITIGQSLDRDTLASVEDGRITLPLTARGGLAYRASPGWLIAADATYEPWSAFESTFAVGGFDPAAGTDVLQDRLRVGVGTEIAPAGGNRAAGLLRRASYRLGGYAERGLYAPTGSDVMTYAATGGVSLPNRFSGARLDLGLEVGTRGTTADVLVRDTFVRGTVSLTFGERWFVRRRFD